MKIAAIVPLRAAATWLILLVLTIANPILGSEGAGGDQFSVIVFTIAVVKVRLVGLDFMELRKAPVAMWSVFEAYCLILWAVLAASYLWL